MTEENPADNIETLAFRAKEMLERVRGAADPDALTPPPLPLSTSRDRAEEEKDAHELENLDSESTETADAEDSELVELDQSEVDELDAELDDTDTVDADDADDADTEHVDEANDADEPDVHEMEIVDFDDEIVIDQVELAEPLTSSADLDDADLVDTDTDDSIETTDLEDLDDPFNADDADSEEQSSEDAESGTSLNLFGRHDERDADKTDVDEFGPEDVLSGDVLSEDTDFNAPVEADAVIAELEDLEPMSMDADGDILDLDDGESAEIEGVGYLGGTDLNDASSISTDDLIVETDDETIERLQGVVGLDLDLESSVDETGDEADSEEPALSFGSKSEGVVTGEAVVAGSAIAGAAAETAAKTVDLPDEETAENESAGRRRGRLSDLGPKEKAASTQPQSKGRFSRKPAVDHDLNDLFLTSNSPDQATSQRSFPWLVPLGLIVFCFLALSVLFFSWWAAGGDDDTTDDNSAQVETNNSTDNTVEDSPDPTTVESAVPATVATDTTPPSTVQATETAPTFDSAADLIGAGSNTGDFANLGNALGLQQALEQQRVDENGDPIQFTLLAPSDAAIAKLTEEQLAGLADVTKAGELIDYHFIDQSLTPEFLLENVGGQIMARSGAPISVDLDGDDYVFNGEARVEIAGLEAENGSLIVIDTVLVPPTAAAIEDVLDLGNVQFQTFQDVITDEGKAELANAVTYFNENPDVTAVIGGHTDSDGPADGNQRLSQRRANAVRQFLINAGIDGSRLVATGFGEEQPILIDGVEDKNASRRIEFVVN